MSADGLRLAEVNVMGDLVDALGDAADTAAARVGGKAASLSWPFASPARFVVTADAFVHFGDVELAAVTRPAHILRPAAQPGIINSA
jgi:hypothetical protein